MRKYWSFYWPLALTGLALLLGAQFKNGVLASYPDAVAELATFALASSTFAFLYACIIFVPHMSNVLARSDPSHRTCLRFTLGAATALTVPLLFLAFTGPGHRLISRVYSVKGTSLAAVVSYLKLFTPLLVVDALRNYYLGLLVQSKRTRTVTVLNLTGLAVTITVLLAGRHLGWSAVVTLTSAMLTTAGVSLLLVFTACALLSRPGATTPDAPEVRLADVFHFFWPVATTSLMFALSRPVMYAFVNRTAHGIATVAAMRVAFDFAMLFHNPANQFRHFFATYGGEDPQGMRRFMTWVMLGLFAAMAVTVFSPLARWVLATWMHIPSPVLDRAIPTLRVLCLTPLVITTRNYFHGHLMVQRKTFGMAVGAVMRVVVIGACSFALFKLGRLDAKSCAVLLIVGFAMEAVISFFFVRRTSCA